MSDPSAAPVVELVPATPADLTLLATDRIAFARRMGSPAPSAWPEYPQALGYTIDRLMTHPHEAEWWMHYFLVNGLIVGSGGYVGQPSRGEVEIGYEIAPGFRRRRYATAAAEALVAKAFDSGKVLRVIAHTLAREDPANRVLELAGFARVGEVKDPRGVALWKWRHDGG